MTPVRLFGLTIASEIPLPGLVPAPHDASVDVFVRRGRLGTEADIVIPDVGSFWVSDGRNVLVDAAAGAPERNLRLYLLGSAMGLLLHQRGLFPLHANGVVFNGGAIAVAGASGAGKSTLAAWFSRRGLELVGDDVIAIKQTAAGLVAVPGPPRLRLWRQSLDRFGLASDGLEPSYIDPDYDKWDLPVDHRGLTSRELPLRAVFVLEDGRRIEISRLGGAAAAEALFDHTYRGEYVSKVQGAAGHWHMVAAIAGSIPVYRLTRPRDLNLLDALGDAVLAHAGLEVAQTSAGGR